MIEKKIKIDAAVAILVELGEALEGMKGELEEVYRPGLDVAISFIALLGLDLCAERDAKDPSLTRVAPRRART